MYLRFGDIPENERSKIWAGEYSVGEEEGVSVYDVKIGEDGRVSICLPLPFNRDTFDTFRMLVEYSDRKCYLVDGEYVGIGNDGEPLIKNVKVIREVEFRR